MSKKRKSPDNPTANHGDPAEQYRTYTPAGPIRFDYDFSGDPLTGCLNHGHYRDGTCIVFDSVKYRKLTAHHAR
jgi:hypothetical protein